MILTEEEAKLRWCPSSMGRPEKYEPCEASDCMAWRWEALKCSPAWVAAMRALMAETGEKAPGAQAARKLIDDPETRARFGLPEKPYRGWCGLAGEPNAYANGGTKE